MKLFDFFTSTRRPDKDTPAVPRQELIRRLLELNRPTAPFQIRDGAAEGVDLVAEWKIVDAQWHQVFRSASLEKVFKIHLKLDESSREVRAMDQELSVAWEAAGPSLRAAASAFKGQKQSIEFGSAYAFTETAPGGQIYKYRFDTRELKKPIQDTVTSSGWTYKGVAFGKL